MLQPKKTKLSRKSLSSSLLGETETAQIPHEATSFVVVWMFCLLSSTPQAASTSCRRTTSVAAMSDVSTRRTSCLSSSFVDSSSMLPVACSTADRRRERQRTTCPHGKIEVCKTKTFPRQLGFFWLYSVYVGAHVRNVSLCIMRHPLCIM